MAPIVRPYTPEQKARRKEFAKSYRATPDYRHRNNLRKASTEYRAKSNARRREKRNAKKLTPEYMYKVAKKLNEAAKRSERIALSKERKAHRLKMKIEKQTRVKTKLVVSDELKQIRREKKRAYNKAYAITHREQAIQASRSWKLANREKAHVHVVESRHRRRARKKNNSIGNVAQIAAWEIAWRKRKSVTCYWCNLRVSGNKAHMDHINPLSKGGAHSIENLCISCQPCNSRKHATVLSDWNQKITMPVLL